MEKLHYDNFQIKINSCTVNLNKKIPFPNIKIRGKNIEL